PDVELGDAELIEQVQDLDLLVDVRIDGARALDAVAQRLAERDGLEEAAESALLRDVPVEEEIRCRRHAGILRRLDEERDALPAADAGGADAALRAAAPELVQEVRGDARARCGQRMPDGDGASVDVGVV